MAVAWTAQASGRKKKMMMMMMMSTTMSIITSMTLGGTDVGEHSLVTSPVTVRKDHLRRKGAVHITATGSGG